MTDAPKIETQAPERVWLKPCDPCKAPDDYYVCDPLYLDGREVSYVKDEVRCRLCGGGLRRTNGWMTCVECAMTDDFKSAISRPDLSAAREAAAAQEMREAITNSLRHAITLAEERLAGAIDEPWSTKHDKCVAGQVLYQEAIEYIDRLPLPDTAALDRLIAMAPDLAAEVARLTAERDALRAYAREAIIHASNNLSTHLEQYHDYEEETPERRNLRGIMHHLEGTLMGMDDDADNSMPPDETAI